MLKLLEPWTSFYVHIDKNVKIEPFKAYLPSDPRIKFLHGAEREEGTWGDIGIVRGTINAMKKIRSDARKGYVVLISGQDYPLKDNNSIHSFFDKRPKTCFIDIFPMPHDQWHEGGMDRIEQYKLNKSTNRGHFFQLPSLYTREFYSVKTGGKMNYLMKSGRYKEMRVVLKRRKFPNYIKAYGGGQWWALPVEFVDYVLKFIKAHPDYVEYHRHTLLPDEIFFHSIIAKGVEEFSGYKIQKSLMYTNWIRPTGPFPATFEKNDIQELLEVSSLKLFARKFDSNVDEEIFDLIDQKLILSNR